MEDSSKGSGPFYVREATIAYGPRKRPSPPRIAAAPDVVALAPIHELRSSLVEHFACVALDAKNKPVAWSTIAIGSISACPVSPADVFRFVVLSGAPACVVAHNHPSGDPAPSPEDIALTDRLVAGARVLGIHLVDHVIIAEDGHFSFLDAGLLAAARKAGAR